MHLDHVYTVHMIVTQGCGNEEFWVTLYRMSYALGTDDMVDYMGGSYNMPKVLVSSFNVSFPGPGCTPNT